MKIRALYSDGSTWTGEPALWPSSPATSLNTIGIIYLVLYVPDGRVLLCGDDFYSIQPYENDTFLIGSWAEYNPHGCVYQVNSDYVLYHSKFCPKAPPYDLAAAENIRLGKWVSDQDWRDYSKVVLEGVSWQ